MAVTRRDVWRYYTYRITVGNGFWLPVGTLYMQSVRGFGLDQIGFVMGAFSVAMVAAELPTGYLGDRLGRRASLLLGNVVCAGFMAAYTVVTTPEAYVAIHVVWAFGWAFRSGTADAWLYELLAAGDAADQYARISGRASTIQKVTEAGTAIVAGAMVTHGWALPFQANALVAALGVPVLLSLPADPNGSNDSSTTRATTEGSAGGSATPDDEPSPKTTRSASFGVGEAARTLVGELGRPELRWLVVYSAVFSGFYQVARVFEQPAMNAVGLPTTILGVVYAGFKLASATAAASAGPLQDRFGTATLLLALVPLYAVGFLSIAFAPILVVPLLMGNRALGTLAGPIRYQYVNDRVRDQGRATVLSGVSMALVLTGGVLKYLGGSVAAHVGLLDTLVGGGLLTAAVGASLWVLTDPVRPGEGIVDATTTTDGTASTDRTASPDGTPSADGTPSPDGSPNTDLTGTSQGGTDAPATAGDE